MPFMGHPTSSFIVQGEGQVIEKEREREKSQGEEGLQDY
jgi:hypothetical protein